MNGFLFLIFIGLIMCYSKLNDIYKSMKKQPIDEKEVADKQERQIVEHLHSLKGKVCEITPKELLIYADLCGPQKMIIQDVDDEWVLVEAFKSKKQEQYVLRLNTIKQIKEIK